MKLPALCLASVFAGGVALGLFTPLSSFSTSVLVIRAAFLSAVVLIILCTILLHKSFLSLASVFSQGAWLVLGVIAAWCASQPPPQNYVLNMVAVGRLDLSSPLRWHARLRDEPAELPWGISYDLALDSVEFEHSSIPLVGGMRLSYSCFLDCSQIGAPQESAAAQSPDHK